MPDWVDVASTLGAAVIGGLIAPQLMQAKERRAARAAVREKIADVEALRWEDEPYRDFQRAVSALEAAAILARLPRKAVRSYLNAADAARRASYVIEDGPDGGPETILLNGPESQAVKASLEHLGVVLWHPWTRRFPFLPR